MTKRQRRLVRSFLEGAISLGRIPAKRLWRLMMRGPKASLGRRAGLR